MSPIFVRPVREQLEHDRLIRFLQAKYKRRFEVAANLGDQQLAPARIGSETYFPDLVLTSGKRLAGVVEVETGESVNNLEAMAQWAPFSRAKAPFHLYVPVHAYDAARRLSEANHVAVTEVWTYRPIGDQFDLVRAHHDASAAARSAAAAARAEKAAKPKAAPRAARAVGAARSSRGKGAPAAKTGAARRGAAAKNKKKRK